MILQGVSSTTFENSEKQHLRRKELERHLQVIASAGATSELELYSDSLGLSGLADGTVGQPLTKAPPLSDSSVSSRRRPRSRLIAILVASLLAAVVLCSLVASSITSPAPSVTHVDEETARYRHLFSLILDFNITTRNDLDDEHSPQTQALHWLAFQDTAEDVEDLRTRFSLAALYFSTQPNGTSWAKKDKWLSASPVCFWHGVECLETQAGVHLVKSLNLSRNGLAGTIPEELSLLQRDCQVLDLSYNDIHGTIPTSIGKNMENLQRLYLGPNRFDSSIPESMYKLGRLTHLYIDSCKLHGSLSTSIGTMSSLHGLALHDNQLTGTLPQSLGALTGLRVLNLDENDLKGTIPSSLGSLTGLVDMRLDQNALTGSIPTQFASLVLLQILYLDNNKLGGKIPTEVAESLPFLSELHLHNNAFTGTVPSGIGNAPFLQVFYLDGNNFTGTMPEAICDRKREGALEDLWADCGDPAEVQCPLEDCCTRCLPETP